MPEKTPAVKNVIYLIPDGGGYALYDFADMVKKNGGFDTEKYPNKTPTNTDELTMKSYLAGSMKTSPYTGGITDSAAAGTAMATGHKTINGYLGIDYRGRPKANLVEAAQSVGKSTGLVATYEWMHATPGAFSAHATNRSDYFNIYQQIENKGIDVVLGAGYGAVSGYASIQNAIDRGYKVVSNKADLAKVSPGEKIWGNIADPSFPYDINLSSNQATLAEMTQAAITSLSANEEGFFLMVEGSKVDTGGHANDAVVTTSEYLAFDAAFKVALDFAKSRNDTVIVCAPDHDTGGMILKNNMASEVALVQKGTNPSSVSWASTNHTEQNVGVWMYVPEGVSVIDGLNNILGDSTSTRTDYVIDNTDIAPYVASLMDVDLAELTDELFVNVTDIGVYMTATGRFRFNNGDKYVYVNQSSYYKDGKEISMGHKEAIILDGKIYVPAEIVDDEDWNYVTEDSTGITGSGTAADPYIIDSAYDFVEFTGNMIAGNNYSGKYIRQEADIDLAGNIDYTGVGSTSTFSGIYNGNGFTINLGLTTDGDKCPFPYVTGTIMNLGTTGYITCIGTQLIGGIARSVRLGAKIVNCYSTATLSGYAAGGISYTNYGTISNCHFGGIIDCFIAGTPIAATTDSGQFSNCYYLSDCGASQGSSEATQVSEGTAASTLAEALNSGRKAAAAAADISEGSISYWHREDGSLPVFFKPIPTVSRVTVNPGTATVNKGDGLQFSAVVEGEYNPSQEVVWSLEPQSSNPGTYIAEDGYLIVAPDEILSSFTILAKSVQDGGVGGISRITVGDEVITKPNGSRARPYLIEDEADFLNFTYNVLAGTTYKGVYFKQTADLDMAGFPGYHGLGSASTFSGIYNGNGHTINLAINSDADQCLFPYTDGIIMNLGTTGSVSASTYAAGICRSIRQGGALINCWSTATLTGSNTGGIVWSNYGTVANCYFGGTISKSGISYEVTQTMSTGVTFNTFYVGTDYIYQKDVTEITDTQLKEGLVSWLNTSREKSAGLAGCLLSDIMMWVTVDGQGPRLRMPANEEGALIATALSDIEYKDGCITGIITLEQCPSDYTAYIALYDHNSLLAVEQKHITDGTKAETFEILYSISDDVSYTLKLLLWDKELTPCALPASASF